MMMMMMIFDENHKSVYFVSLPNSSFLFSFSFFFFLLSSFSFSLCC